MMTQDYSISVNLPDVDEFLKKYSRYSEFVSGDGRVLYDLIVQPEVFVRASVLADYGLPSVLAVAEDCKQAIEANNQVTLKNFTKQFIGAAVCTLMEANGYKKTGTKKSVPHESFSTGEFYVRARCPVQLRKAE